MGQGSDRPQHTDLKESVTRHLVTAPGPVLIYLKVSVTTDLFWKFKEIIIIKHQRNNFSGFSLKAFEMRVKLLE